MKNEKLGIPAPMATRTRVSFDARKTYIVIGGLGGMGLEISRWLVTKGARNLIITSRSGIKTNYHKFFVQRLEEDFGANVKVLRNDVSKLKHAKELIDFAQTLGPVGGIFNLAMVLKDALFENQTSEMFEECCNIKIRGTDNLDQITRVICPSLDHFVCFSSLVSTIGNAGQSNYGFANSFMYNLCAKRREDGLPGLSIGWGAIGDVGHVAEHMGNDVVIAGSIPQRINSCFDVLERVLYSHNPVVGSYIAVDRSKHESSGTDILGTVLNVLGIKDHSKMKETSTLGDLGLDSLMAVEIKQILEKKYEKVMSAKEIRELTVAKIQSLSLDSSILVNKNKNEDVSGSSLTNLHIELELSKLLFTPLNDVSTGKPIFVFPPIEGSFGIMEQMLDHLNRKINRPLVGVNWITANDDHESIGDLANFYIDHLFNAYPHVSNYDFLAYSFGTLVAMDIALKCQNEITDRRVDKIIIIDWSQTSGRRFLHANSGKSSDNSFKFNWIRFCLDHFTGLIKDNGMFDFESRITSIPKDENFLKYFKILRLRNTSWTNDDWITIFDRLRRKIKMFYGYDPKQILNQNILLIRATKGLAGSDIAPELEPDYELSKYIKGKINVIKLDGDHDSVLLINSQRIADEVHNYLT